MVSSSSTSEETPAKRGSVSGKCSPIVPSAAAPSSASMTACVSTSASECPRSPREYGTWTPPSTSGRPSTSPWRSYPMPTLMPPLSPTGRVMRARPGDRPTTPAQPPAHEQLPRRHEEERGLRPRHPSSKSFRPGRWDPAGWRRHGPPEHGPTGGQVPAIGPSRHPGKGLSPAIGPLGGPAEEAISVCPHPALPHGGRVVSGRDQLADQGLLLDQLLRRHAQAVPRLVVVLDALHHVPRGAGGDDRVAELQALGHAVLAPARHRQRRPVAGRRAARDRPHGVDDRGSGRAGRRQLAGGDDRGAALLDG